MKRSIALIIVALIAIAVFVALVYAALIAAHVSEPAATTVQGLTPRRLWATTVAALALVGVVIGGLSVARSGRTGAIVALVAGLIAAFNGGLNLAIARGGLGSGNGVVGGAVALVLGLIALALGAAALVRSRHARPSPA